MLINMVLDNGFSLEEWEFTSFDEFIQNMEKERLDKHLSIQTLYYKNETSEIEFCWNKEALDDKGYFTLSDIQEALYSNTFVVS